MNDSDVTIALVNYKTPELLKKCLTSIYRYTKGVNYQIYLVDNASRDGSVEMVEKEFPQVKLIINKKNLYATGGFNQILKIAKTGYCLVLSSDVEFLENSIFKMVKFLDKNKKVAAVSCLQVNSLGIVDTTCSRFSTPLIEFWESSLLGSIFKNNKLLSHYRYKNWDRAGVKKVNVISDTIMLARTDVLNRIGFYDEGMNLFFMENDLCLRFKKLGFSVWHLGTIKVLHHKGQSTLKFKPKEMYKFYEVDMLYYYKKHFGLFWWLFLKLTFIPNKIYWFFKPVLTKARKKWAR